MASTPPTTTHPLLWEPACCLLKTKHLPSLGEGWEEETEESRGPSHPTPIQVLMSSSLYVKGVRENTKPGGCLGTNPPGTQGHATSPTPGRCEGCSAPRN